MKSKSSGKEPRLLTEVELEMMNILWKCGEATVHQVIEQLPKSRKLAYTSVSTMLRILESKEVIGSRKDGRGHTYFPRVQKEDYELRSVKELVDKVFDGTSTNLVRCLLNHKELSDAEREEIKKLLS